MYRVTVHDSCDFAQEEIRRLWWVRAGRLRAGPSSKSEGEDEDQAKSRTVAHLLQPKDAEVAYRYLRIRAATAESHARKPLSEPQFEAARNATFLAKAIQRSAYHSVLLPV